MEIGVVGKPNVGKSTFFTACTLAKAEIASYPFTTIKPNRGVAYVRTPCPHVEFETSCMPKNSECIDGTRFIPVELIDVAGLVPDAHTGKGLGNQFLDDLRPADALIHIIDASGATDIEGNPGKPGDHDPLEEVQFLQDEIDMWIRGIIKRDFSRMARHIDLEGLKVERALAERLTAFKVTEHDVHSALRHLTLDAKTSNWSDDDLLAIAREVRSVRKPILIVANKIDIAPEDNLEKLKGLEAPVIFASAEYELNLRKASEADFIDYKPGDTTFKIMKEDNLSPAQIKGLDMIRGFLEAGGGTGVQGAVEHAVYKLLDRIVVYPVEDENKMCDKDGNVLPDAYLMPRGSTAKDLAYKVHSDFGDNFIRAINARTHRVMGADHELQDQDVVKIVAHV